MAISAILAQMQAVGITFRTDLFQLILLLSFICIYYSGEGGLHSTYFKLIVILRFLL